MHSKLGGLLLAASLVAGLPQVASPTNDESGQIGGLFGMSFGLPLSGILGSVGSALGTVGSTLGKGVLNLLPNVSIDPAKMSNFIYIGSEYPKENISIADFYSPGTGPYPAHFFVDPSLPNHVVYAPKTPPPADLKMPVLLWGNGGCSAGGTPYGMFLTEIASHGYIAIAHGAPGGAPPSLYSTTGNTLPGPDGEVKYPRQTALSSGTTRVQDLLDAQDWVVNGGASKLGNVDIDSFITAGTSCGGLLAYSASYKNPRVKLVGSFNSGLVDASKTPLLKELTAKIAYISGGSNALEFANTERDYDNLNEGQAVFKASLDTGHLGTFFGRNGGKYANATVDLFDWVFRNDQAAKERWTNPRSAGSLVSQNWNITFKNV